MTTDIPGCSRGPFHSPFFPRHCDLHGLLQARGIDTLLVGGTVTNVCGESTARRREQRVLLVADAFAAMRDRDHNATLHVVASPHRSSSRVHS